MYTRLYQQCQGTTPATSSVTKFMPPHSCNYYIIKKQRAENLIPSAPINIKYNFPCIDYNDLEQDFKKVVETESGSKANLFNPINWGPSAWKFFEAAAFGYPDKPSGEEKQAAFNFFESLRYMLPCGKCKDHYKDNFSKLPVNVESRDTLSRWVVEFHNIVNQALGKPNQMYDDVASRYPKEECDECNLEQSSM